MNTITIFIVIVVLDVNMKEIKKYKSPRRLKVKPPKVIPHSKIYNRKKSKKVKYDN